MEIVEKGLGFLRHETRHIRSLEFENKKQMACSTEGGVYFTEPLKEFIKQCKESLPKVRRGVLADEVDKSKWPDFRVYAPNPTLMHAKELPQEKYKPLSTIIYFWVPDIFWNSFVPTLKCPTCKSDEKTSSSGWNPRIRQVHDTTGLILIICKRYRCEACPLTFNGHDVAVVEQLPDFIKAQIPNRFLRLPESAATTPLFQSPPVPQDPKLRDFKALYQPVATFREKLLFEELLVGRRGGIQDFAKLSDEWNRQALLCLKTETDGYNQLVFLKTPQLLKSYSQSEDLKEFRRKKHHIL